MGLLELGRPEHRKWAILIGLLLLVWQSWKMEKIFSFLSRDTILFGGIKLGVVFGLFGLWCFFVVYYNRV